MEKYQVILKPPGALSDYENNPRNNDEAVKPVMESIRQYGFRIPILIDKGGTIIAGHTKKRAACDTPFFYFFTRKRANPVKQ